MTGTGERRVGAVAGRRRERGSAAWGGGGVGGWSEEGRGGGTSGFSGEDGRHPLLPEGTLRPRPGTPSPSTSSPPP